MKKIFSKYGVFFLGCNLLWHCVSYSQIKFAPSGELKAIPPELTKITTGNVSISGDDDLKAASAANISQYRQVVKKKIDETITVLNDPTHYLYKFYNKLWPAPFLDDYKKELSGISDSLDKSSDVTTPYTHLQHLVDSLNKYLLRNNSNVYNSKIGTDNKQLDFFIVNPFNQLVVGYYNKTAPGIPAISSSTYIQRVHDLDSLYKIVDSLINKCRKDTNTYDPPLYRSMEALHRNLNSPTNTVGILKGYISSGSWFKNWLWFRGGLLKYNPLDFTTDAVIRNNPEFDTEKSAKFNLYIDKVIDRMIELDTFGTRIAEFKKILAQKGTGKTLYSFKERLDSIQKANDASNKKILVTSQILNRVKVPGETGYFTFSSTDGLETNNKENKKLTETLNDDETKTLVIHNNPKGSKVTLIEKSSFLKDRSAFQEGLDEVFGQLGELAKLVSTLSGYSALLTQSLPTRLSDVNAIPLEGAFDENSLAAGRGCLFQLRLEHSILSKSTFIDRYYLQFALDFANNNSRNYCASRSQPLFDAALSVYFDSLNNFRKSVYEYLQRDSADIIALIDIFSNSSIPSKKIKAIEESEPIFYSEILTTKEIDSTKKQTVNILAVRGKDSTTIHSFSYNVGKRKYIQLGAGLAYTITPFTQTEAAEENGTITIKNKAQQYRLVAGLSIYPWGLVSVRNKFVAPKNWKERLHGFIGVGIPKPLDNIYLGAGWDFGPGLKFVGGWHLVKNNFYNIQNNTVIEQRTRYGSGGLFLSIQIDPISLLNLLNVFSKKKS